MIRLTLTAAVLVLAAPAAAQTQTALSLTDQQRTVCVPKRDAAGNKIGGQICMTGKQWQQALAKVRVPAKYRQASRSTNPYAGAYLSRPNYFRISAWSIWQQPGAR